jgi:hypothetical protein
MMPESPRTIQIGEELLELEDPFYVWTGGEPYDTGRPSVVIHVSPENGRGDSLAFLQRRLRDEYTQRQGDEPGAKRVRIVANKPKLPDLAGTVATFDLTDDEWELETSSDRVRVERNGRDALEYVEAVVRSSFTGDMGYLIVNVPNDWQDPVNTRDVFERIHDRLEPSSSAQTSDWLPDDRSDAERPLVTRCEPKASIDPQRDAALYWFGKSLETDGDTDGHLPESVEGYEALFDEKKRRFDWVSSVLTEQDDDESEEHYLLKGAVTAALARRLYEHESNEKKLEEYVLSTLLSQGESVLETECDANGGKHSLDCYVEWSSAFESFVSVPEEFSGGEGNLIVEVETGRGGGNTNFRKIWDTIDRVKTAGHDDDLVCVVVPPRLLSKTDAQAEHLLDLVSLWNRRVELDSEGGPLATLAVPVFDQDGACEELRAADEFVKEVYSGE